MSLGVVLASGLFSCDKRQSSLVDDTPGRGFMGIKFLVEDRLKVEKGSSKKASPCTCCFKCPAQNNIPEQACFGVVCPECLLTHFGAAYSATLQFHDFCACVCLLSTFFTFSRFGSKIGFIGKPR